MADLSTVTCADLLVRAASGDRAAFRLLYAQAGPQLYAICLRMMRARDQADDVFQDAFTRIWERSYQFHPERGEAMAWLATVTRNCALDRLRKSPRGQVPLDETAVQEIDAGFDHGFAGAGSGGDLRRCLGALREDYRTAVVLAFAHGLTHAELAARLGKPSGTIKSWVRRGLEQLKECMGDA